VNILTNNPPPVRPASKELPWQKELRASIRDPHELCRRLGLSADWADRATGGASQFPVFVPPSYLARIAMGDPHDPLLRQVLPLAEEMTDAPGFGPDPVEEVAAAVDTGILQKYAGRALLVVTGVCAVHCRYCFRRHFPYQEMPHSEAAWDEALAAIAADNSIHEVILSGGDPLVLPDRRLATLARKIAAIPHVRRLRIHTRLPVMIPARVTDALLNWLTESRLTPIFVIHANHAQELDNPVAQSLASLRQAGITLLNQAVLLRGVNDSVAAQVALSERLIEIGVVPYYLHQLDRVAGAAQFEVPVEQGLRLVEKLRGQLPGYMVPRYVQEIPGEPSKVVLL